MAGLETAGLETGGWAGSWAWGRWDKCGAGLGGRAGIKARSKG